MKPKTALLLKRLAKASGLPDDTILELALNEWRRCHCASNTVVGIELAKAELQDLLKQKH